MMAWSSAAAAADANIPLTPPPPWSHPAVDLDFDGPGSSTLLPRHAWRSGDPRSSSTQSLVPSFDDDDDPRRILLIVYIHGFMGNDTSFQSFPAHVHNYLREALAESHVIHSKIYPRYKTYKAIDVARDNFSKWLEPHESNKTDVILVGHSMGGLLAADVALMPSTNPVYGHPLKHRILGTISMDAPLLGLHPGIIKSGLASLFRKAPDAPGKEQQLADSLASQNASSSSWSLDDRPSISSGTGHSSGISSPIPLATTSSNVSASSQPDPNFNPAFFNDVQFTDRGWWRNVAHFAKKHYSEGIFKPAYQHLLSHLEFGSCLADYTALNKRYNMIRRLEDVDELHQSGNSGQARVRYVNYYTVSTGIPKKPPTPKRSDTHLRPDMPESRQSHPGSPQVSTPKIAVEDYSDGETMEPLTLLEPVPEPESDSELDGGTQASGPADKGQTPAPLNAKDVQNGDDLQEQSNITAEPEPAAPLDASGTAPLDGLETKDFTSDLPPIPSVPEQPKAPDFEKYTDKDARKQAEKEFKRLNKTYEHAIKNRDKAIKERQKLVEKRRKKAQKEAEKRQREHEKRVVTEQEQQQTENKQPADVEQVAAASSSSRAQVVSPAQTETLQRQLTDLALYELGETPTPPAAAPAADNKGEEKKKLRKFCMLPQKVNGARDPTWVQVYMDGVDEVGAHCGLFFPGPHYEVLVGEVGERIADWVRESMSVRAILAVD